MNWTKLLYVLIIVLLYVPMVFLGANVFFPKYTGSDSYYQGPFGDCYAKYPYPVASEKLTNEEQTQLNSNIEKCQQQFQDNQRAFDKEKFSYDGMKYVFISLFNLAILLFALFMPKLQDSVTMGLFLGSIAATFGATLIYFEAKSKLGFIVLVIIFFAMLYFINRKKDSFLDWGNRKK